jgi:hypothetical protein
VPKPRFVLPSLAVTATLLVGGFVAPAAAAPGDQKPLQPRWSTASLVERGLAFFLGELSEEGNSPDPAPAAEPSLTEEGSTPQLTGPSTTQISPAIDPNG